MGGQRLGHSCVPIDHRRLFKMAIRDEATHTLSIPFSATSHMGYPIHVMTDEDMGLQSLIQVP